MISIEIFKVVEKLTGKTLITGITYLRVFRRKEVKKLAKSFPLQHRELLISGYGIVFIQ